MTTFLCDIYGSPVSLSVEKRRKDFARIVSQCHNCGIINCSKPIADLYYYVENGWLSPISASYFLTSRATSYMDKIFDSFRSFILDYFDSVQPFNLLKLWQRNVKVENISPFPLVELGFDFDF